MKGWLARRRAGKWRRKCVKKLRELAKMVEDREIEVQSIRIDYSWDDWAEGLIAEGASGFETWTFELYVPLRR